MRNYLSYLATWDEPLNYDDLRFDLTTFERLSQLSPVYDATDPNLRPFRDAGGKLILWHGWHDPNSTPLGTIAYYQAVQDTVGGLEATQQFARLYLPTWAVVIIGALGVVIGIYSINRTKSTIASAGMMQQGT